MKKNRITEIIIATILIISLASTYKYHITDKKNEKDQNVEVSGETAVDNGYLHVDLEKEDFIKTQMVELNQPLSIYESDLDKKTPLIQPADKFDFEFSNFRIFDKMPIEFLNEMGLSPPYLFKEDGGLKNENTYIAKVDFTIKNKNNKTAETSMSGFEVFQLNNEYEKIYTSTHRSSVFNDSEIGLDENAIVGPIILKKDQSYTDTVYFVLDKVMEDKWNLVIQVAPHGGVHNQVQNGKSVLRYNNGFGYIKVKYQDIIWE